MTDRSSSGNNSTEVPEYSRDSSSTSYSRLPPQPETRGQDQGGAYVVELEKVNRNLISRITNFPLPPKYWSTRLLDTSRPE